MKYKLETDKRPGQKRSLRESSRKFLPLFATEKRPFAGALVALMLSSLSTLVAPILIVRIIVTDLRLKNTHGLLMGSLAVLGPPRMDYQHTITAVSYIARLFDKVLNESE